MNLNKGLIGSLSLLSSVAFASPNIIGGQLVKKEDQLSRFTVGVVTISQTDATFCTGVVVDGTHVLTAGYCLKDAKKVFISFSNIVHLTHLRTLPSEEFRPAESYRVNQPSDAALQLGLVKFTGSLPAGYEPANFLDARPNAEMLKKPIGIAGFGKNEDSAQSTQFALRSFEKAHFEGALSSTPTFVISGLPGKHAFGKGDAGGPIYSRDRNGNLWLLGFAVKSDFESKGLGVFVSRPFLRAALSH